MSELKHTPGPWDGGRDGLIGRMVDGRYRWTAIASVHVEYDPEEHENADEGRANAHLIAAAPQLLEAGDRVMRSKPLFTGEQDVVLIAKSDLDALRAAIAAATGDA